MNLFSINIKGVFIAAIVFPFASFAAPQWVNLQVSKIYVPMGFDSNDNTQIMLTGSLPNLCYKSPKVSVVIEGGVIKLSVQALFEGSSEVACAEVAVPFLEKVNLNILEAGSYVVKANLETASLLEETLTVKQAASVDVNDHIYARVDYVERKDDSRTVLLKGYNPSDCFELDRIDEVSNEKDTYSVKPIMKKIREFCPLKMVPFEYKYDVPEGLPADEILLHVRTMQGDSVNTLFTNKVPAAAR